MTYDNKNRGYNNSKSGGYSKPQPLNSKNYLKENFFYDQARGWIKSGADQPMIDFTEKVGTQLESSKLTTSQFRNVYGELKRIQMSGYEKHKSDFLLLQPKVAYAYARAKKDSKGEGMDLFKEIFDELAKHVETEKDYNNFVAIFEALIAYHKAAGGK